MKRASLCLAVVVCLLTTVFMLRGSVPVVGAGQWTTAADMSDSRDNAVSVLLANGDTLIAGGSNSAGPLQTVDVYHSDGTLSAAASMQVPRSRHTATLLQDGRVLVAGGDTGAGAATNSAEIYDPSSDSWTPAGTLNSARFGHSAILLDDGSVAIIGGESSGSPVSTIEIYDPSSNSFSQGPGLNVSRKNAAAAKLADGRVLISGGFGTDANGNSIALKSAEIFDPKAGTVTAAADMNVARGSHSATSVMDGQVVVAGGSDGQADLISIEIYSAATDTWKLSLATLSLPRSGHNATLLPNNNSVLISGGASNGTAVQAADVYQPWTDAAISGGTMNAARANGAGSAFGLEGLYLAAGGSGLKSTELYRFPTIRTDKPDYSPGEAVQMTGTGYQPGETVNLNLKQDDGDPDTTTPVQADAAGNISYQGFAPDVGDVGTHFHLTAIGQTSGLQSQTIFTDANANIKSAPTGIAFTLTYQLFSSTNCTTGGSGTQTLAITSTGINIPNFGNTKSFTLQAPALSDQGTSFTNWTVTASASTFTGTNPICVTVSGNPDLTATYNTSVPVPTLNTISPNSGDLGQTLTNVILTGTNFANDATVAVAGTGVTLGTVTVNSSTQITISSITIATTATTLGGHNITVTNPVPAGFTGGGSSSQTFTVNKRTTTTSAACSPTTVPVGTATSCTATVTDNDSGTTVTPSGTVSFTSSGSGNFSPASCTLSGTGATASCSSSYTPSAVGSGTHTVTGSYGGDTAHGTSNGNTNVTVTKATVTATVTANNKIYDATTTATQNTCTLTGVLAADTGNVTCSASTLAFTDKNVGTSKTVNVSGIALSGSAAGNYQLSSTTGTTTANITARPLTITAATNTKTYDGTTSAAATPTITSGTLQGTDTANFTETYSNKNVGTGKTLTPSGSVSDGNSGNNYSYTFVNNTTGVINARSLTVTASGQNKVYDGTTTATVTLSDNRIAGDVFTDSSTSATFSDKNVGTGKTVTVSGISISGTDAGNYTLSSTTATTTANITARSLTVTATGINKVYDGTTTATVTLSDNRVSGDSVTDSFTSASFADKNVGNNKTVNVSGISIGGTDAGNYNLSNTTATTTANITPRTLHVSAMGANKIYDGTTAATVTLSDDRISGDVFTDSFTSATFADKNVGNGKSVTVSGISISGTDSGNYSLASTTVTTTANITPRTLHVTATGVNKIYDGTTAATVTLSDDRISGDVFTDSFTSASFADKNVSNGKAITVSGISISGTDSGNYSLASTTVTTTANITPRTLHVTATGVNKIYDGTTAATVTLSDDRISGDMITDSFTSATFSDKNAGNGKTITVSGISISGTDSGNYSLASTTVTTTANITPRTLHVTATGVNKIYDGTTSATVTLSDDRISGDVFTDSFTSASFADKNVSNGKAITVSGISISGTDSGNYSLASTTVTTTANITPRTLHVSATGVNKIYDGTTAATVTLSDDRISGDVFTDSFTSASFADKNVSNGKAITVSGISISGTDSGNYSLANTTATATANITPRPLHVTATGVDKIYDGTTAATANLSDDRVAGDVFTDSYSTASFADKNVGNGKTVTVSGISISGTDAGNYGLNSTTATTTANITARTLHVTATGANKVYDGTTAASVTLSDDRIAGDLFTDSFTTALFADKNAGIGKTITVGGVSISGTDAGNYQLASTIITTTANITPRPLHITATGINKIYDGTTAASVSLSDDRIGGDVFTDSFTSATFPDKNVGNAKPIAVSGISISGLDAGNYTFNTTASASADITPRALHITATGVNKVYDGTTAATVNLSDDRVAGDVFTDSYLSASFADKNVGTAKPVSVSGISISGTDAGNYTFNTSATATADITPASLTITAVNASKTYGQTVIFVGTEFVATGLISPDTVNSVSLFSAGAGPAATVAGSPYPIVPSAAVGTGLSNYNITYVSGLLTVNPAGLTITANNASKTFGQTFAFAGTEFTTVGLLNGDSVASVTLTSAGADPSATVAGSPYDIVPSAAVGSGLGNYTISYLTGLLTVTPASTTTVVSSSLNPSTYGDAVTFTATVSPVPPSSGTPTGTVSFSDGAVTLASNVSLSGGQASFTTSALNASAPWNQLSPGGVSIPNFMCGPSVLSDGQGDLILYGGGANGCTTNTSGVFVLSHANGQGGAPTWTQLSPTGSAPPGTHNQMAAYDPNTNTLMVFGGCEGGCFPLQSNVYILSHANGQGGTPNWSLLSTAGGPPSTRISGAMAYDPNSNRLILFGGQNGGGSACGTFSDTWVLSNANGTGGTPTWTQLSPAGGPPAGQYGPASFYDVAHKRLIVAGGDGVIGSCTATNAVWALSNADGTTGTPAWTNLIAEDAPGAPSGFSFVPGTYDPANNRALLVSGTAVWQINNANGLTGTPSWTLVTPGSGPSAATSYGVINDSATNTLTSVYNNNETWVLPWTHVVTATYSGDSNFDATGADPASKAFGVGQWVNQKSVTATVTAINKVYDGTTTATQDTCTLSGVLAADTGNVTCSATTLTFTDKNVGAGKTVNVSGISISGSAAGNYHLSSTSATTTADITARALTITATGVNKVYDGTTTATVTLNDDRVSGDVFTDSYASAGFADKNAGTGKAVSVSGISISGPDAGNYTFNNTASTTADITARALTITATGINKVYDGTTAATVTLSDNRVSGDVFTDSYASATFNNKNAGTAKPVSVTGITITGTDAPNYTFNTTASTTADITPRPLTITATGVNKVYDGTTTATVTLSDNRVSGDVFTDSYTSASFADKNAGTAKPVSVTGISISGTDAPNYTFNTTASATADITPRPLTITATGVTKVYDGTATATVTLSDNRVSGDVFTDSYTSATFNNKNAGTAKPVSVSGISISGTDAPNYTFNTTASTTADITPRPLTVTAAGVNKVYDGTTSATVILSDNRISGDVFSDSYASATFNNKNAGTAKPVSVTGITITGTDAPNYTFNTTASTTADITPRPLTITATGVNKVYDGTTTATVTLSDNRISGDVFSDSYTSASFADKNAATAKPVSVTGISISGTDAPNYTFNTAASATADITPRPLTITATGVNKVYDGTTAATVTLSDNRISGDVFIDSYTGASFVDKNVGTAKPVSVSGISISGTDAPNYTFNTTASTTADITPRPLTVTATGVNKVYDGTATATVTLSDNRVSGDVFADSYASATFNNKNAGTAKPVSVTGITITGTDAPNYTFNTTASTTADITPRPLTITATGVNKVYDGTTTATVTLSDNRISGDVFSDSYTSASFADKNAATAKPVSVTGISISGTDAPNYTFNTTATTTADITARPLVITATGVNKVYDGNTTATVTLSDNRVSGDVFTDSYTSAGFADKNVGTAKPVSVSGISISGTDAGNYTFNTTASATANITPRPLTVTATGLSKVYDSTTAATVTLSDNRVTGDVFNDSYTSANFADSSVGNAKPVSVTGISISGTDAPNYTFNTTATTTANITPAALTITANNRSKTYGQTVTFAGTEFTSTGLLGTDSIASVTLTSAGAAAGATVGSYPITPGAAVGAGLTNYTITYVNGTLTVGAASLTITANNRSKTYGQTVVFNGTEFTATGLLNGDTVTSVALTSAGAAATATVTAPGPNYPIIPSAATGSGLSNYTISYVNGTLTVSPAALTITAKNQTKTYGATFTFAGTEFIAAGLLNGNSVSSVTLTSAGAPATATVTAPGPNYAITVSAAVGSGLGNYTIGYVSGTLTVTPAALTITANNRTKILGQTVTFAGTEFTTAGLVNGDTVTSVTLTSTGAPAAATVGTYPIIPSAAVGSGLGNYSINYVNGTLTVLYAPAGGICDGDVGHTILQPINADGSGTFKQGSTVPAKFRVCDANGNSIGTPGTVTAFNLISIISGTTTQTVDETVVSTTPDTAFRWDPTAQQWIFNISTKPLSAHATYVYRIQLNDGSSITFQYGLPK